MYEPETLQDFYKNYGESLSRQYETSKQLLDQQRTNAQASIMGGANKVGMLYSSFVPRDKVKYDANTYVPTLNKTHTSYQTGLDSLRQNILKYQNSIADIQDAIAHLNSLQ